MADVLFILKVFIYRIVLFLPFFVLNRLDDIKTRDKHEIPLEDRYGIVAFTGLAGFGKTSSMTHELIKYRKKYGDDIYIVTNYPCSVADAMFTSYKQLCHNYNKTIIVGFDELQNVFTQNDFKDFPPDFLDKLTQVRKNKGMKLFYTTQDFREVTGSIRRLTDHVCECKTFMRRLTWYYSYRTDYYLAKLNSLSIDNKLKIPADKKELFIHTKKLHATFDSFAHLKQLSYRSNKYK